MAVVIGIASDEHCRSTVGLISPGGVPLSDGGHYTPSKGQRWLWDNWLKGWEMVGELAAKHSAPVWWVNNGDLVDGFHHQTPQVVSIDSVPEREVVRSVLDVPLDLDPERVFMVRGTESHVGPNASSEESIARALSDSYTIEADPDTGNFSWWHLMMECEGVFLDFTHHGRTGMRPWTQWNATALLAAQITMERVRSGDRIPDLAIRSHYHRHADSYDAHPVRVIQTPAFQLATAYVHKRVPESLADIGMLAIVVDGDHFEVHKSLHIPSRGHVWKASQKQSF
jgi:hypothetical protein